MARAGVAAKTMRPSRNAADLKFLRHRRRIRTGDFKSKCGTLVMFLLVPMTFRSSRCVNAATSGELRKAGMSRCQAPDQTQFQFSAISIITAQGFSPGGAG